MFFGTNTSAKSLLITFSQIYGIIWNFDGASCRYATFPMFSQSLENFGDDSASENIINTDSAEFLDFKDVMKINNYEYPEKELENIVEETKRIIESLNRNLRKKIKVDGSYDFSYLMGENKKLTSSTERPPLINLVPASFSSSLIRGDDYYGYNNDQAVETSPEDKSCIKSVQDWNPRFLNGRYIINTSNFKQTVEVFTCRTNETCDHTNEVLEYKTVCTQEYKRIELIGLPAYKEFNVTNQQLVEISVPSGCKCSLLREQRM